MSSTSAASEGTPARPPAREEDDDAEFYRKRGRTDERRGTSSSTSASASSTSVPRPPRPPATPAADVAATATVAFSLMPLSEDEMIPIPFSNVVKELSKPDVRCWGCECYFGKCDADDYPDRAYLYDFYCDNKGRMADDVLYDQMAELHRRTIYDVHIKNGMKCIPWPKEAVRLHCDMHLLDAKARLQATLQQAHLMKQKVYDDFLKVKPSGAQTCNEKAVSMFDKLARLEQFLATQDPAKMRAFDSR